MRAAAPARVEGSIWDVPVRLVHWLLVLLIAFSWWSAENGQMDWHLRSGLGVLALLVFRLAWGVVGSSTARFASFVRAPGAALAYWRDSSSWRGIGHNPAGAWSVVGLLTILALQVATGLVSRDTDGGAGGPLVMRVSDALSDVAGDLHETGFNLLLALVALHVAAIAWYRWKGERLVRAMVTGRGPVPADAPPLKRGSPLALLASLTLAAGVTWWVANGAPTGPQPSTPATKDAPKGWG